MTCDHFNLICALTISLAFACSQEVDAQSAPRLRIAQTDATITVLDGESVVLTYNKVSPPAPEGIDPVFERSGCLHPVCTPAGHSMTMMFPFDHAHQHGIFSAWVRTQYDDREIDFWNLAGGTGRVLHEKVVSVTEGDAAVGFEVDLIHRAVQEPAIDVLRERWKVTVHPTDGAHHCFDLETTQAAITDKPLRVKEYHYGGIAFRGQTRWLTDNDSGAKRRPELVREPGGFTNSLGSDRVKGNHEHAQWVTFTGQVDGEPASITVLCHPDSFRAPQAARLHPSKPYFVFAPCVDGSFVIDREHPFQAKYRYLLTDTEPDAKWIQQQWDKWFTP